MTTTPEHAGAVERLTNDLQRGWITNTLTREAVVTVLAALSRADARVLELVGALEKIANGAEYAHCIARDKTDATNFKVLADASRSALNATSPGMGEVKE